MNKDCVHATDDITVLPCPFCGNTPIFPKAKDVFGTYYEAGCEKCGIASISIQISDFFDDYKIDSVHDSWDNKAMQYGLEYIDEVRQESIELWNTRAR